MKTTNAKAKAFQTPAGPASKEVDNKTISKQTSARRPKQKIHTDPVKLDAQASDPGPLQETDIEYCPPRPKDLPDYPEDFPPDLDYSMLQGENLMRGYQELYFNPVDENGVSRIEKKEQAELAKAQKEGDEAVMKAMEDIEWTVRDVPETFEPYRRKQIAEQLKKSELLSKKGPPTVLARRAASALSSHPKPAQTTTTTTTASKSALNVPKVRAPTTFLSREKKAPLPSNPSAMSHTAATVASRSTIGYSHGRSASGAMKKTVTPARSASTMSSTSGSTITPARFAKKVEEVKEVEEWRRPKFLGAFEVDEEDLEPGLRGALPECLRGGGEEEEEFVMTLN